MANYTASARSNKFRVKDIQALERDMHPDVEVYVEDLTTNTVCLLVTQGDSRGWPSWIDHDLDGETVAVPWKIEKIVAPHLLDDEWCVIQEIGNEKLRYLIGYSMAFNNQQDVIRVDIGDIYQELPEGVTPCTY